MSIRQSSLACVFAFAVSSIAVPVHAQTLMTSASAVRLRAEPTSQSRALAELALGTILAGCDGAADGWLHVETADGRAGWIHSALVIELPASGGDEVVDALIQSRLRRAGDGLAPRLELVAFVERALASAGPGPRGARLDLYRLKAIAAAIEAMPFGADPGADLRGWLAARDETVAYDPASGRYRLKPEALRRGHNRHRAQSEWVAEELSWLLATTGFMGDCEGSLVCYVARTDAAEGDYLRWYPEGRHVDAAMRRVMERAAWWKTRVESGLGFDAATECRDIAPLLGTIRFGVETATHPDREKAVALIDAVRRSCG